MKKYFKGSLTHILKPIFVKHLLENGYVVTTMQELLGHHSIRTTMFYTHVMNRDISVRSTLDLG
jgi:site-specific recombinase XerD